MKSRKRTDWSWPPPDQWFTVWGGFITLIVTLLISELFTFFSRLTGTPWIGCYAGGLLIATLGVSLLFYAKLPLYRQRRFLTFGSRALPAQRRPFYCLGYALVILAATLLGLLLLAKP